MAKESISRLDEATVAEWDDDDATGAVFLDVATILAIDGVSTDDVIRGCDATTSGAMGTSVGVGDGTVSVLSGILSSTEDVADATFSSVQSLLSIVSCVSQRVRSLDEWPCMWNHCNATLVVVVAVVRVVVTARSHLVRTYDVVVTDLPVAVWCCIRIGYANDDCILAAIRHISRAAIVVIVVVRLPWDVAVLE